MWSTMKYEYKSFLKDQMNEYLVFRRTYGYKTDGDYSDLAVFDRVLVVKDITRLSELTVKFYLKLTAELLAYLKPQTVNSRMGTIRSFYKFLQRQDYTQENPLASLPKIKELYYSPYVFDSSEIRKLLDYLAKRAAGSKRQHYFTRFSHYSTFALQAACGLRISEAINLKISDCNLQEKTLYIRRSKFRKDRLIPISSKTVHLISNYLSVRDVFDGDDSPYVFLNNLKTKQNSNTLAYYFKKAAEATGLFRNTIIKGDVIFGSPSPHSLRHSFAVSKVRKWKADGKDIDMIADTLATYMGHADFSSTQVYLKALSHNPKLLIFDKGYKKNDR
jgi:integrase/recombinase XerD